jgi:hypothetical protein
MLSLEDYLWMCKACLEYGFETEAEIVFAMLEEFKCRLV